ncbi:MAG: exopolygalacturonase [Clostridia bacterium]|nr:exopolygalacturonase [Clostridia bacterium]
MSTVANKDIIRQECFPDGTVIDRWFYENPAPDTAGMGKQYVLTDYIPGDKTGIYTKEIQSLIDYIAAEGGGILVVPRGVFCTGAIFFRQGVNLCIEKGGVLKGSDDVSDYPVCDTRIEGENCKYLSALINADGLDGFTMFGEGTVEGNGEKAWKAFWHRRKWNPQCTNKDEQRPRLVYFSNCRNVTVFGLTLQNSHFWTNHLYRCDFVKYINCRITSPSYPVPAPSADGIDIDVCRDVLIKNCYFEVNDDSVVLKGGKGPYADTLQENGINERVIIEDCECGLCHGCLTCGSESVHNKNIIIRRVKLNNTARFLWLKMRPDTPQNYEYITAEEISGTISENFIDINPWTQFYDLKGRKDIPLSYASDITIKNCKVNCKTYFNVRTAPEQYRLSGFRFESLDITAVNYGSQEDIIENFKAKDVYVKSNSAL